MLASGRPQHQNRKAYNEANKSGGPVLVSGQPQHQMGNDQNKMNNFGVPMLVSGRPKRQISTVQNKINKRLPHGQSAAAVSRGDEDMKTK